MHVRRWENTPIPVALFLEARDEIGHVEARMLGRDASSLSRRTRYMPVLTMDVQIVPVIEDAAAGATLTKLFKS